MRTKRIPTVAANVLGYEKIAGEREGIDWLIVTLIAAVNECSLQLSVAGWSIQHRQAPARRRRYEAAPGRCAVVNAHMK
jgi:hypothetical protein